MTTTKIILIDWLKRNRDQWVSSEQICTQLGISRTAIWKQIKRLKEDGHIIESAPRKGYRLKKVADLLESSEIASLLQTRIMGRSDIFVLNETDSTNLQAKIQAVKGAAEGTLFVADTQTQGRGRRGRDWYSPAGRNIYTSLILRPTMPPSKAPQITLMTAVAVATTLIQSTGLEARIKWPNDILVDGKKIAGILTEISTELDMVDFVVVGIGINVNTRKHELQHDIRDIATSIRIETGGDAHRVRFLCNLLENFEACYNRLNDRGFAPIMDQWRSLSDIVGQQVYVDVQSIRHRGIVEAVDNDGVLILKDDRGDMHRIFSGDVTRVRPTG